MRKRDGIGALIVLLVALSAAGGQDTSTQQPADAPSGTPQQPVPAFGLDNPAPDCAVLLDFDGFADPPDPF